MQRRSLISAAVHSKRVGSQHHPVPVEGSLLSPVTPQLQSPSRATQTGLQNIQINPAPDNNFSAGAEQHGVGPSSTLGPNPPRAHLIGTPGTSAPTHDLPPLPQKILQRITKREYIDFADLLADNLYPHPSLTPQNQYQLEVNPQDPSALAIVPSQQRKRRVDGLHSWLEAWNIYLRTVLHHFPFLAPDLLAYQDQICKFSRKFRASTWIMYDTAFRYMTATNPSMSWGKINDQLYNDILKEETLPFCISCHSYGHRTINCPTHSQATQSFRRPPAQTQQFTSGSTSSTTSSSKPLINTQQVNPSAPSQNFTCRDSTAVSAIASTVNFCTSAVTKVVAALTPVPSASKEFNNVPSSLSCLPPSTPVCIPSLAQELKHYPDQQFATDLLHDLQFGCHISYQGPRYHRITPNLKSTLLHPEAVT